MTADDAASPRLSDEHTPSRDHPPALYIWWERAEDENLINWNDYYPALYRRQEYPVSLWLENRGGEPLYIRRFTAAPECFAAPAAGFMVPPGQERILRLIFTAPAPGRFEGRLTIFSNDPRRPEASLSLAGTAQGIPQLSVEPDSLGVSLFTGGTAERVVNLLNRGDAGLDWRIYLHEDFRRRALAAPDEALPPDPPATSPASG